MSDIVNECSKELNEKGCKYHQNSFVLILVTFHKVVARLQLFFVVVLTIKQCLAIHLRMLLCTVIGITPVVTYTSQSIRQREGRKHRTTLIQSQFAFVEGYKVGRKHNVYEN